VGRHSTSPSDDLTDWRSDRVGSARRGENPMVLAKMRSGWAVMGDTQFLPGYCLLLSDVDGADHLTDLAEDQRVEFLRDMARLGEAMVEACTGLDPSFRRVNYEILGNEYRHLHAHLYPRYAWEPAELLSVPVARYPRDRWTSPRDAYSEEHEPLRQALTEALARLL
jgi:diadenosine tetraphosphate (Ap4A) HIT family hydrolase